MPLLQTRGAGSARGFGFSATQASGGGDSTVGIFALGQTVSSSGGSTTRNKYTFATCASTACGVGVSSCCSKGGSASGNSTRIIFQLGNGLTLRNKYTYATCTSTSATPNCSGANNSYSIGNSTRGMMTLGSVATGRRNKYTYATDTSVNLFNMLFPSTFAGYGAGTSCFAIINMGANAANVREKYTYATCTGTYCGIASASVPNYSGSATGNSTQGFFQFGATSSAGGDFRSNIYTYATNTSVSGANTTGTFFTGYSSAAGTSTRGIFALGRSDPSGVASPLRCKYTFATNTRTTTCVGTASTGSYYGAAASFQICVNA
jgi:hypothetical protein